MYFDPTISVEKMLWRCLFIFAIRNQIEYTCKCATVFYTMFVDLSDGSIHKSLTHMKEKIFGLETNPLSYSWTFEGVLFLDL